MESKLYLKTLWILLYIYSCKPAVYAGAFDCNFDKGLCDWRQDTEDDFNWTRLSGSTPNRYTGPKYDHTSGEGYYVFIDTSKAKKNETARLISPRQGHGQYCFSLWYYMYGWHVDKLTVSTKEGSHTNELFVISGNQQQKWILKQIQIDAYENFMMVIEGRVRNQHFHGRGDIAIDDIVMFPSKTCPQECGNAAPEFGSTNSNDTKIGSTVQITCQTGYIITGNPSIVCQANGSWSDSPACYPIDCGIATLNRGLKVRATKGTTYNMTVTLDCIEGFTLVGNANMTCQADGNWTTQPNCAINNCSDPTPVSGIVNSTNFQYGSVLHVTCNQGFKLSGNSFIICQSNLTWTDSPECEQIDCRSRTITNGRFNATLGATFGKTAIQSCDTGYTLTGDERVTCFEDGWNGTLAICSVVDCSVPFLTNGIPAELLKGTTYNQSAVLACVDGYTLTGNATVTCQADGNWTAIPKCISEGSEASSLIAVYVTVPAIVLVLVLFVLLMVYILRKGHPHCAKNYNGQQETKMSVAIQYPDKTYEKLSPRGQSKTDKSLPQDDEEYATIADGSQFEAANNVYYNTSGDECTIKSSK